MGDKQNKEVVIAQKDEVGIDEIFCFWFKCPNCGDECIIEDVKFCSNCGCKIKWELKGG